MWYHYIISLFMYSIYLSIFLIYLSIYLYIYISVYIYTYMCIFPHLISDSDPPTVFSQYVETSRSSPSRTKLRCRPKWVSFTWYKRHMDIWCLSNIYVFIWILYLKTYGYNFGITVDYVKWCEPVILSWFKRLILCGRYVRLYTVYVQ